MLARWKDLIAVVVGMGTIGGGIVSFGVWFGSHNSASASEVRALEHRQTVTETNIVDIKDMLKEQRVDFRDLREQLNQWAVTGHLPVVSESKEK